MWPTATTAAAGVIGSPVRHSLSPALHNAAFAALGLDWVYLAFEVPPGAAAEALAGVRALGLAGLNVTMPHKADVARLVDRLTPAAEVLSAVNTVVRMGDRLVGDNTDGPGLIDALRRDEGFDPAGRRCFVYGSGGAARAVVRALALAGAEEVTVAGRTPERVAEAVALAGSAGRAGSPAEAAAAELVVNATPVGMGDGDAPPFAALVGAGQVVVDLIYHPAVTPLLTTARARGATAVNGLGMLIHQAAHAFRAFTGADPPLEAMSAAAVAALAARGTSSR